MSNRSKFKKLKENYRDFYWWKLNIAKKIGTRLCSYGGEGTSVKEDDWDNLIILDDCRYDTFRETYLKTYDDEVQCRISKGENTDSFLARNFPPGTVHDVIYLSANPRERKLPKDLFTSSIPLWEYGWDEIRNTVPPETVYLEALKIIRDSPDKVLIVHFLQPHCPYPNGTGPVVDRAGFDKTGRFPEGGPPALECDVGDGRLVPWPYFGFKKLPADEMYRGYVENLEAVLPYARRLADILPGRTVITADHGEAFGERMRWFFPMRVYGHPGSFRIKATVTVPWVVIEAEAKKAPDLGEELESVQEEVNRRKRESEKLRVKGKIGNLRREGKL